MPSKKIEDQNLILQYLQIYENENPPPSGGFFILTTAVKPQIFRIYQYI